MRERWKEAFRKGELALEKLGGAHLLLHGIWGFRASAEGERTDLVLQEPIKNTQEIERTSEALVLTEWKRVSSMTDFRGKYDRALSQAQRYSRGILAGFELFDTRYLVFVSKHFIKGMTPDTQVNAINYRHINIAVEPKSPSKT